MSEDEKSGRACGNIRPQPEPLETRCDFPRRLAIADAEIALLSAYVGSIVADMLREDSN